MYEVHSNYGGALFETEEDALNALFLLSAYHNLEFKREDVKEALGRKGYYENSQLSVVKIE